MAKLNYLDIMDDVLIAITESESWQEVLRTDSRIDHAQDRFYASLEIIRSKCGDTLFVEIEDRFLGAINAHIDAAVLYGMHVGRALGIVTDDPCKLNDHILKRYREAT